MYFGREGDAIEHVFVIPKYIKMEHLPDFLRLGLEIYEAQQSETEMPYVDIAESLVGRGLFTSRNAVEMALRSLARKGMVDVEDAFATGRKVAINEESVKDLFERLSASLVD